VSTPSHGKSNQSETLKNAGGSYVSTDEEKKAGKHESSRQAKLKKRSLLASTSDKYWVDDLSHSYNAFEQSKKSQTSRKKKEEKKRAKRGH